MVDIFKATAKRNDREYYTGDDIYLAINEFIVQTDLMFVKFILRKKIYSLPCFLKYKKNEQIPNGELNFFTINKKNTLYIYDNNENSSQISYYIFDLERARTRYEIMDKFICYHQTDQVLSNLHILIQSVRDYLFKMNLSRNSSFACISGPADINKLLFKNSLGKIETSSDCSFLILRVLVQNYSFQLFFNLASFHE